MGVTVNICWKLHAKVPGVLVVATYSMVIFSKYFLSTIFNLNTVYKFVKTRILKFDSVAIWMNIYFWNKLYGSSLDM